MQSRFRRRTVSYRRGIGVLSFSTAMLSKQQITVCTMQRVAAQYASCLRVHVEAL